jgi:hypothetical protein
VPPGSSYTLDSGLQITGTPCDESGIRVNSNTISTDEGRGGGAVQVTDSSGNKGMLSVSVANVFSVFIRNGGDGVSVQADS